MGAGNPYGKFIGKKLNSEVTIAQIQAAQKITSYDIIRPGEKLYSTEYSTYLDIFIDENERIKDIKAHWKK